MTYETVLFDFHGVFCRDFLFSKLGEVHAAAGRFLQSEIFGSDCELVDRWMRGGMTVADIQDRIVENSGIDPDLLSEILRAGIEEMNVDRRLLQLAKTLADHGVKVAMVTDNMDIFSDVIVKRHRLSEYFPLIVNSCEHGLLKKDENGRLFDIVFEKLGVSDFGKALLIDDSKTVGPVFRGRGGSVYTFETYEKFEPWMKENLLANLSEKQASGR